MSLRVLLAVGVMLPPAPPLACPFCALSLTMPSLQKRLEGSAHALLAETVSTSKARITAVLRSTGGFAEQATIDVGEGAELALDTTWLVLCDDVAARPRFVRLSEGAAEFAVKLAALPPAPPEDARAQAERLAFFLPELGNPDLIVAASVTEAFSRAPYAVVKDLRPRLDVAQLEGWLGSAPPQHRGVLYLLLGIEGSARARELLRQRMRTSDASRQAGYDGLLGALILVDGEAGLTAALAARPAQTEANGRRVWYAQSLMRALQFHLESESVLPSEKLIDAVHSLFDDPYAAGPAIGLLIAQKHWGSIDRVLELRARWASERPSIDRATRRFLTDCGSPRSKQALDSIEHEQGPHGGQHEGVHKSP